MYPVSIYIITMKMEITIRITQSGSVAGSLAPLQGFHREQPLPLILLGRLHFNAATNTPASMSVGPISLGMLSLTLKPLLYRQILA